MLDVFKSDAFSMVTLTESLNKVKFQPGRIGRLGLFRERGITTTTAIIEEKDGQLELIQTSERGAPASPLTRPKRKARSFLVPHLVKEATIIADSLQGVRAFGSENEAEGVQAVVNDRLETLRALHEVTQEFHRLGAIKGVVLDADGTTEIHNLFTEFGVSQNVKDIALSSTTTKVRKGLMEAKRVAKGVLGGIPVNGWYAFCGDSFFDTFVEHDAVKETLKYQESGQLRNDAAEDGFSFAGIRFENYIGSVSGQDFINTDVAYLVPVAPIFHTNFAPGDFLETVNTVGLPYYAKVKQDDLDRGVLLHTQSNPLSICTMPGAVIKLTKS